ncbi:39S ribosomal protein L39, mitochondrial [Entelurus aequoreus]|uniref:39S ribosomal protein L39, mitochondrial n=1 Tax=Entelurus aequoreus TaxID=161455 RepID=UPI002B1D37A9|nr:39S ribosomal protein L39, mitochondrial [Entelurus aequoreus]XP_061916126.1 39S ribosomal protein L39, mitochondrial [Entelurus aequoreus]XP_061916134.1 39S ribosomal protein L39, mitochondrial [Entelurus aequoreus]
MMAIRLACQVLQRRFTSTAAAARLPGAEARSQRNAVFSREQARQRGLYPRVEKIEVSMQGPGLDGTLLIMNRGMSTPLSCAKHLTEYHVANSVLALVDGELWPLHQPLTHSCTLSLLMFKDSDPTSVNEAYWRSCTALLGQVLETAFKDEFSVQLLNTPEVPVTSGAFLCDVVLDPELDSWTPSEESLRSLTKGAQQLILQDLAWEPLEVSPTVALEAFSHSRYTQEEVEQKASQNPKGTVLLYRCGDHVMLSGGPLVARTGLCSQYEVTAVHSLGRGPWGLHRRVQGLSLPLQLQAHHTVWRKLRQRAEKLVDVQPPEKVTPPPAAVPAPTPSSASQ